MNAFVDMRRGEMWYPLTPVNVDAAYQNALSTYALITKPDASSVRSSKCGQVLRHSLKIRESLARREEELKFEDYQSKGLSPSLGLLTHRCEEQEQKIEELNKLVKKLQQEINLQQKKELVIQAARNKFEVMNLDYEQEIFELRRALNRSEGELLQMKENVSAILYDYQEVKEKLFQYLELDTTSAKVRSHIMPNDDIIIHRNRNEHPRKWSLFPNTSNNKIVDDGRLSIKNNQDLIKRNMETTANEMWHNMPIDGDMNQQNHTEDPRKWTQFPPTSHENVVDDISLGIKNKHDNIKPNMEITANEMTTEMPIDGNSTQQNHSDDPKKWNLFPNTSLYKLVDNLNWCIKNRQDIKTLSSLQCRSYLSPNGNETSLTQITPIRYQENCGFYRGFPRDNGVIEERTQSESVVDEKDDGKKAKINKQPSSTEEGEMEHHFGKGLSRRNRKNAYEDETQISYSSRENEEEKCFRRNHLEKRIVSSNVADRVAEKCCSHRESSICHGHNSHGIEANGGQPASREDPQPDIQTNMPAETSNATEQSHGDVHRNLMKLQAILRSMHKQTAKMSNTNQNEGPEPLPSVNNVDITGEDFQKFLLPSNQ